MRKFAGFLLVAAMALPTGLLVSAPAGAAAAKPTCKTATGTATFSPALPIIGSKTKVKPTIKITGGKLGGCTGGGVTAATLVATLKFGVASNCSSLLAGAATGTKGTETITWNTKKTSTVTLSLAGVKGKPTQTKGTGPVTAGLFKGSHQAGTLNYTVPANGCTKTPLSKVTFKQVTPVSFK